MKQLIWVGAGGAIGSVLRYLVSLLFVNQIQTFPYPTFLVNALGCFFIGYVFSSFITHSQFEMIRLFFMIGILGGFTTFSAYSLEMVQLLQQKAIGKAFLYFFASNIIGVLAAYTGFRLNS